MRSSTVPGRVTEGSRLALSALLSQVLVAFTIEFDNEFERRMPHRTSRFGVSDVHARYAPWLVSLVMWANVMQYVRDEGITIGELFRRSRITKNNLRMSLNGLRRWGYLAVKLGGSDGRTKVPKSAWIVRPTEAGRAARKVWATLGVEIEKRWEKRNGKANIARLRKSLASLLAKFDVELPDYFPVLKYGLFADAYPAGKNDLARSGQALVDRRPLYTLLSQTLLIFTMEFERGSNVSLAVSANIVRVLDEIGVVVRDLPRLSGVSKEAVKMSLGLLERGGYVELASDSAARRTKLVRLTAKGEEAKKAYLRRVSEVEDTWSERFGEKDIFEVRELLERLLDDLVANPVLLRGLKPPAGGWRESMPNPETLPHQPMVLHRGGYPDGS